MVQFCYPMCGVASRGPSGPAAAPPSSVMNARRLMGPTPFRPGAADYQLVQAGLVVAFGLMHRSPALGCD
jgi:hypothetical protein